MLLDINRGQNRLAKLTEQVSSGMRVHDASDDPSAFARAKGLRGVLTGIDQYQRNIGVADDRLSVTDGVMGAMEDLLVRAKEMALAMSNGTVSADQRRILQTEAIALIDEMVSLGNAKLGDEYLFAGHQTGTEPFAADGTYAGDSGVRRVEIGEGVTAAINTPGDTLLVNGTNVFATLQGLRDALGANDVAAIQASLDPLDASIEQVTQERMKVGLQLNKTVRQNDRLEEVTFQTTRLLSEQEDVDMASAVSALVASQNALALSRSALSRLLDSQSLLNFLR